jgi:hypothetical protein
MYPLLYFQLYLGFTNEVLATESWWYCHCICFERYDHLLLLPDNCVKVGTITSGAEEKYDQNTG